MRRLDHTKQNKLLGEILVELNVLSERDVLSILLAQQRRERARKFGEMGRIMGLLREEHILAALAVQLQLVPNAAEQSLSRVLRCLTLPEPTITAVPRERMRSFRTPNSAS